MNNHDEEKNGKDQMNSKNQISGKGKTDKDGKKGKVRRETELRLVKGGEMPVKEAVPTPAKDATPEHKVNSNTTPAESTDQKKSGTSFQEAKTEKSSGTKKQGTKSKKQSSKDKNQSSKDNKQSSKDKKQSSKDNEQSSKSNKQSSINNKQNSKNGKKSSNYNKEEIKSNRQSKESGKEDSRKTASQNTGKEKEKGWEKEKEKKKTKTQTISPFTARKKEKNSWERQEPGEWFLNHKSLIIMGTTAFAIAAAVFGLCFYLITAYKVTTVYVDGNIHYSNEEVMNMVMTGWLGDNSLYLAMKYKNKGIEGIPFVEKMDVNVLSPDTIRINVYEKALAGYIEYLGRYIYFDKDGIAVESSDMRTKGIPQVTGLDFGYVVLYEPLPVEEEEIFKNILNITQLLGKYELAADKIFFDSDAALTLFFGDVRVNLGKSKILDEKMMRLQYILPELEGKKGTLSMENMDEEDKNVTFHSDESG